MADDKKGDAKVVVMKRREESLCRSLPTTEITA